jgi:hypothetical protein
MALCSGINSMKAVHRGWAAENGAPAIFLNHNSTLRLQQLGIQGEGLSRGANDSTVSKQ